MTGRKTWTPADVVDVSGPPALLRNYLEQRDVREYVQRAEMTTPITRAYDVGCGFGRLTPVLAEFASAVVGFEREASLLATARTLLPALEFVEVATLSALPAPDASAEFVMTFTVLQHMPDSHAEAVIREITRVLAPQGHVLAVEETDPGPGGRRRGPGRRGLHTRAPVVVVRGPIRAAAVDSDGSPRD